MSLDSVFTWRTSAFQTSQNGLVDSLVPRLGGALFLQVVKRIEKRLSLGTAGTHVADGIAQSGVWIQLQLQTGDAAPG